MSADSISPIQQPLFADFEPLTALFDLPDYAQLDAELRETADMFAMFIDPSERKQFISNLMLMHLDQEIESNDFKRIATTIMLCVAEDKREALKHNAEQQYPQLGDFKNTVAEGVNQLTADNEKQSMALTSLLTNLESMANQQTNEGQGLPADDPIRQILFGGLKEIIDESQQEYEAAKNKILVAAKGTELFIQIIALANLPS